METFYTYLFAYGFFLAKTLTILISLIVLVAFIAKTKKSAKLSGFITVKNVNNEINLMRNSIVAQLNSKTEKKAEAKKLKEQIKRKAKEGSKIPNLFCLNFKGDLRATGAQALRNEVTAIIGAAKSNDEVLVTIESPGGSVNDYGFAASQMKRLRDADIKLTVAIDKVAASGGYLMAVVANQIIASPFAYIGSIGVVSNMPNFNRLLDKAGIDVGVYTAGKNKRNVSLIGKNDPEKIECFKEQLSEIHSSFKNYISKYRDVDLSKVAEGDFWLAEKAIELNLVDKLQTSDDFILENLKTRNILQVEYKIAQNMKDRIKCGFAGIKNELLELLADTTNSKL